jgi:hypothetical protein
MSPSNIQPTTSPRSLVQRNTKVTSIDRNSQLVKATEATNIREFSTSVRNSSLSNPSQSFMKRNRNRWWVKGGGFVGVLQEIEISVIFWCSDRGKMARATDVGHMLRLNLKLVCQLKLKPPTYKYLPTTHHYWTHQVATRFNCHILRYVNSPNCTKATSKINETGTPKRILAYLSPRVVRLRVSGIMV